MTGTTASAAATCISIATMAAANIDFPPAGSDSTEPVGEIFVRWAA
jgi:hypothetical protein